MKKYLIIGLLITATSLFAMDFEETASPHKIFNRFKRMLESDVSLTGQLTKDELAFFETVDNGISGMVPCTGALLKVFVHRVIPAVQARRLLCVAHY